MPILRTYRCQECGYGMTVELRAEQWDTPPPECPQCARFDMGQEFAPPAITGSAARKAADIALDIAENDYKIADIQPDHRQGSVPKVRYRDQSAGSSSWGAAGAALEQAVALGRENRLRHGSGLEVLQTSLKNGTQPDLIEISKRRSIRGW